MHAVYYFHKTMPIDAPLEEQLAHMMDAYGYYQQEMLDDNNWDRPLCYVGPNGEFVSLDQDANFRGRWELQNLIESARPEDRVNQTLCLALSVAYYDLNLKEVAPDLTRWLPDESVMVAPYLTESDINRMLESLFHRLPQLLLRYIERAYDSQNHQSYSERNNALIVRKLIESCNFPFVQPVSAYFGYRLIDLDPFHLTSYKRPSRPSYLMVDIHV